MKENKKEKDGCQMFKSLTVHIYKLLIQIIDISENPSYDSDQSIYKQASVEPLIPCSKD